MFISFSQSVFISDIIEFIDADHFSDFIISKSSNAEVVSSYIDMNSIPLSTITLNFTNNTQLGRNEYTMDLSSFSQLKSFECGDNSFNSVRKFIINGLNQLESIVIGKNSFTLSKNSYDERLNREFHVTNCSSLRELSIDRYSFSDYHIFDLSNLPNLKSITIGSSSESFNFYYVETVEFSSLPSLETLELGYSSFSSCHDIIFESKNDMILLFSRSHSIIFNSTSLPSFAWRWR